MINKELISKVEGVIAELDRLEKYHRIEGSKAFEIDDQEMFKKIQVNTYKKVRQIKKWKDILEELSLSMAGEDLNEGNYEIAEEPEPEELEPVEPVESVESEEPEPEEPEPEEPEPEEPEPEEPEPEEPEPTEPEETKIALRILGKTYPLKYWSAVLIKVCQEILVRKPYIIAKLDQDKMIDNPEQSYFSYLKSDINNNPRRLHNGMWIEMDRTADEVLEVVNRIRILGGYDEEDIIIEYE